MSNRERFLDALIENYREMINETVASSEYCYKTSLDVGLLNKKLQYIYKSAAQHGIPSEEIDAIVEKTLPDRGHEYDDVKKSA